MAKPAKRKEVAKFLGNKLEMESDPSGPHEGYKIPHELSVYLPGVVPINLQHGRDEVSSHIVRQICDFLGLSYEEFLSGKQCHIGGSVIYRAFLWKHLEEYFRHFCENASAFEKLLDLYVQSAEKALPKLLSIFGNEKLSSEEDKLVLRIHCSFRRLYTDEPNFRSVLRGRLAAFGEELERSFLLS